LILESPIFSALLFKFSINRSINKSSSTSLFSKTSYITPSAWITPAPTIANFILYSLLIIPVLRILIYLNKILLYHSYLSYKSSLQHFVYYKPHSVIVRHFQMNVTHYYILTAPYHTHLNLFLDIFHF